MSWTPTRTFAEADAILCAPGMPHEMQTQLVDGRVQRVYRNLWPSLRVFWLWAANQHADLTYIVFEDQRCTYSQILKASVKAASIYVNIYGIKKGDRVGICSRNYPEFLAAFWACHLIGAVSVMVNAWLPVNLLRHCFTITQCKLIILDTERADCIEPISQSLRIEAETQGFIILHPREGKGQWKGMQNWDTLLSEYTGDTRTTLECDPGILPEDNATVLFTSGTTGLPKGALSTQRQFLTNILNSTAGGQRSLLRQGLTPPLAGPQKAILISIPLFHVAGLTTLAMMSTAAGLKIVLIRKWTGAEAASLIRREKVVAAGGVPSMVVDLIDSSKSDLESLLFGGAPAPNTLPARAMQAFPNSAVSQGYGLTETTGVVSGIGGPDYIAKPTSCGIAAPINDIIIVKDDKCVPPGTAGEIWVRGINVMKEYWGDKDATDKAITKDGWFKTGDLGVLDKEGFLFIRDRIKDIIIRGGENIDSTLVENALYADNRVLDAAAVGLPDARLGEVVAAIVSIKPAYQGQVTEESLIALTQRSLPKFAVPVMILIQNEPIGRTPTGKILKGDLRTLVKEAWAKRSAQATAKL